MWYEPIQTVNILGVNIQVWGLMLGIGSVAGWYLFDYNLWWRKIKFDSSWLVFGFIVTSLVGARLLHVVLHWGYYGQNWLEIHRFWEGGMASYGSILGLIYVFLFLYKSEKRQDILDAAAPALLLALFLARTGCFLINDHFGRLANLPWAINSLGDGMRHPISLYYLMAAGVAFVVFSYLYYQKKFPGRLLWLMLIIYPAYRVLLDIFFKEFQGDSVSYYATILTSLAIIIVAFWQFIVVKYRR